MKNKINIFLSIFLMSFLFSMVSFASENEVYTSNTETILLPKDVKGDMGYGNIVRGTYIASSGLGISNKGYGVIGIYADTLAYVPVKKIRMNFYLDRWDENDQDWYQVEHYNFLYEYKEGGEDLTSASESFSVVGLPTNCYYRLRGVHTVWPFEGGFESQGPKTNGVLIKDGPA